MLTYFCFFPTLKSLAYDNNNNKKNASLIERWRDIYISIDVAHSTVLSSHTHTHTHTQTKPDDRIFILFFRSPQFFFLFSL
jgi:hypothetical protein